MPLTVCKVASIREIDLDAGFCFIGKTDEELSLVCETKNVPASAAEREDGWRAFRVRGVLDFSLVGILAGLTRALAERGIAPLRAVPVDGPLLEPVSLVKATDLGDWWMVKAANMKITVAKADGTIVNVSGGGCPDVPRLAELVTGQQIDACEEPRVQGQTLCAYALQLAFEEARRVWRG